MTPFLKLLYSFSHGRKAHGGVDGVGALHRDGGGGKAALRGGLKVRAVEERAGDGSHEGVAAAGGVDHARGEVVQVDLSLMVGGKHAVRAERKKDALQARGAATESLIVNISRQGLIYIPAMFILGAIFHETGLIWAQPVADVLSLLLAIVLYVRKTKKML